MCEDGKPSYQVMIYLVIASCMIGGPLLIIGLISDAKYRDYLENKPFESTCEVFDFSIEYGCCYDDNNCGSNGNDVDPTSDPNNNNGVGIQFIFEAVINMTNIDCPNHDGTVTINTNNDNPPNDPNDPPGPNGVSHKENDAYDYKIFKSVSECNQTDIDWSFLFEEYDINNSIPCWIPNDCEDIFYTYDYNEIDKPLEWEDPQNGKRLIVFGGIILGFGGIILLYSIIVGIRFGIRIYKNNTRSEY